MNEKQEDFMLKAGASFGAGLIIAEVGKNVVWGKGENGKLNAQLTRQDKYVPHHYQVGIPLLAGGLIFDDKTWSPIAIGLGAGMMIHDAADLIDFLRGSLGVNRQNKSNVKYFPIQGTYNRDWLNIARVHIADNLPTEKKYQQIGSLLVDLIANDTWNQNKQEWIPAGREHPLVLEQTRKIIRAGNIDGHDHMAVLKGIHDWAKQGKGNMNYTYDIRKSNHDTFVHPYRMLEMGSGDCDDSQTLISSMGESVGIPMGYMMLAQKPMSPNNYNHIVAVGLLDEKYRDQLPKKLRNDKRYFDPLTRKVIIPMEVTHDVPFLYHPPYIKRRIVQVPVRNSTNRLSDMAQPKFIVRERYPVEA